jgi:hypothetical protein
VVFNWIVGKFVAGILVTFSGREQNRIGYMYVAGARLELSVGLGENSKTECGNERKQIANSQKMHAQFAISNLHHPSLALWHYPENEQYLQH